MTNYDDLIASICGGLGLRKDIVLSMCFVESNFNTYAMRYESHWRWHFNVEHNASVNNITKDTEHQLQMFSFGLMQVMGSVARELGFKGPLAKLCIPEIGLKYGCIKLKQQLDRYKGDYDKAISAYNQGTAYRTPNGDFRNQHYVDKVLGRSLGKV